MVADYRAGIGSWRLAKKYRVTDATVLARLRAAGVELTDQKALQATRDAETREMRRLHDDGWTLTAIGAKFGITYSAVRLRLKRAEARFGGAE